MRATLIPIKGTYVLDGWKTCRLEAYGTLKGTYASCVRKTGNLKGTYASCVRKNKNGSPAL